MPKVPKYVLLISSIILLSVSLIALFRNLNSGIILGEPDEFAHAQIAVNLLKSPIPSYSGAPFFYDLPGFFLAGSLVSIFIKNSLVSIRFVSLLSTIILGLIIFYYLRRKGLTLIASLAGLLLFYFSPLSVFYSQVGIIEPLLSLLLFSSIIFFDLSVEKSSLKYSFFSGALLALAVFTKYTALYSVLLIVIIFIFRSVIYNLKQRQKGNTFLLLDLTSFIPLLVTAITIIPVLSFFYSKYPAEFKWQTLQTLGLTNMAVFHLFTNLNNKDILGLIFWWFPNPLIIGTILGFFIYLVRLKLRAFFLLASFAIAFVLVSSRAPFYPRYLVILLPYMALFTAVSFDYLLSIFRRNIKLWSAALILLPASYFIIYHGVLLESYLASKHSLLEDTAKYMNQVSNKADWALTNYWPNILAARAKRTNYAWLTLDNNGIRDFQPEEKQTGLEIINSGKAVIVLENLYSAQLVYSPSRYEALMLVKNNLKPVKLIVDTSSNFPFYRDNSNIIKIYMPTSPIQKGALRLR